MLQNRQSLAIWRKFMRTLLKPSDRFAPLFQKREPKRLERFVFTYFLFLLILLFRALVVDNLHFLSGNKSNVILLSPVNAALKND